MAKHYDDDKQIAHGSLRGGVPYRIYYEGGSLFCMVWEDNGKSKQMHIPKDKLDIMISEGKIHLMSATKYRQIEKNILPDGSTRTHNADGTPKSAFKQQMETLEQEDHLIITNPDGSKSIAPDPEPGAPKMPEKKVPGPEDAAEMGLNGLNANTPEMEESLDEQAHTDVEQNEEDGHDESEEPVQKPVRARKDSRHPEDLNGDGIIDEFDDLIKEEQKKNILVMLIFFAGIIVSIFLFFFFHTITASILHGEPIDLIPEVIQIEKKDSSLAQDSENGDEGEQGNTQDQPSENGSEDNGDASSNQLETVNRGDFDPEDAVAAFPMADAEKEKVAVWLFQQVRQNIYDANRMAFEANVKMDRIAGELSPAYAETAKEIQGLTDAEKAEVDAYWRETFIKREIQHVLDKDPYGSIFGGRIREVRQDPNNPLCLYVVTESIAGDHQRACFAINGDSSGNWIITDIMDPKGYVKMIQEGESDQ